MQITITASPDLPEPVRAALSALIVCAIENQVNIQAVQTTPPHKLPIAGPPTRVHPNRVCTSCGGPVSRNNYSGYCHICNRSRQCVIVKKPSPMPEATKSVETPVEAPPPRQKRALAEKPAPKICIDCGTPLGPVNTTGRCRQCAMRQAQKLSPRSRRKVGMVSESIEPPEPSDTLEDMEEREENTPEELDFTPNRKRPAVRVRPFCVHDRDSEDCIHCARMRAEGIELARPDRN